MLHVAKCALAGAAFSASAVIAGSISWTLMQAHKDRKHMVEHWQKRRLEEALKAQPSIPPPREAVEAVQLTSTVDA